GQLSSSIADAVAQREVTLTSFQQNQEGSIYHNSKAKIITDREGKFAVSKMVAGMVRFAVKFDPTRPTRPDPTDAAPQLKPNETLHLQIEVKPAVRVESRV